MQKTDLQQMREYHRRLLLHHIREAQPVSQAQLTRITNLSPTTVSHITKRLLADELICVCGMDTTITGRPPTLLKLRPDGLLVGGIDLGPSRILAAVGDLSGQLRGLAELPTPPDHTPQTLLDLCTQVLHNACVNANVHPDNLHAVSMGLPGLVHSGSGFAQHSHSLNWRSIPVRAEMEQRLGLPVLVDNVIQLTTLAESRFGAGKGLRHLICVGVGSGIGAGIIMDGRLYRGPHDVAVEIGHTAMVPDGPVCRCGNKGCLEAIASGPAIARQAAQLIADGKAPILAGMAADPASGRPQITAELVYKAAQAGDAECMALLNEAGTYLGMGIANLINLFGIETVVIGGGLVSAGGYLMEPLCRVAREHVFSVSPDTVAIRPRMLSRNAPLYGAVQRALEELVFSLDLGVATA